MNTTAQTTPQERKVTTITQNRKARHDYHIIDTIETGIALVGTEVKALREGRCNLQDSFAQFEDKSEHLELWVLGMHISPYSHGNIQNHEPTRKRKLLLHRHQLDKLYHRTQEKGITLVPLSLYFSGPYVKVEIGLAQGKRKYDKRQDIKERDIKRSMQRGED
jgi:SsrA-binding protein